MYAMIADENLSFFFLFGFCGRKTCVGRGSVSELCSWFLNMVSFHPLDPFLEEAALSRGTSAHDGISTSQRRLYTI
jgi:hypothetical protein